MKKIFVFVIALGVIFLVFQFGVILFKNNHNVEYELMVNNERVLISEEYIKKDKEDYYLFKVTIGNDSFVFDAFNKFNKQKNVINDFRIYEENDLMCISPVYIKENDESLVYCNVDKQQVSYTKVKEDYDLEEFLTSLENFDFDKYDSYDDIGMISKNSVYKKNIYDDEFLIVYDYKQLIKVSNKISKRIKFSDYDVYNNNMGILINGYYILPVYESKPEYNEFLIINIKNSKEATIKFDKALSTNLYINGVVNNKLYFFDKSNLVQYEIDPAKKSYRIVGDKSTNGQYYDGEWSTRNIYNFYRQELKFTSPYPIKDNYVEAFETGKYYYYYNSKNEFYKVYKGHLDNPILLFQYNDVHEVQVANNGIYFINEDTIYRYDDTGIKKLVENNEFKYNFKNIYSVYFE